MKKYINQFAFVSLLSKSFFIKFCVEDVDKINNDECIELLLKYLSNKNNQYEI